MNTTSESAVAEGLRVTSVARQMFTVAVQKGCDTMVFQFVAGRYQVMLQRGVGIELYPLTDSDTLVVVALSVGKLVDIRPATIPVVRQGKVKLKLDGRWWSMEIVSIPLLGVTSSHQAFGKPTVAIFFSESADEVTL